MGTRAHSTLRPAKKSIEAAGSWRSGASASPPRTDSVLGDITASSPFREAPTGGLAVLLDGVSAPRAHRDAWLRAINVCFAVAALLLTAPLFLLVAVWVKHDSPGPVFYRQVRIGLDRRSMGARARGRRHEDMGRKPPVRRHAAGDRRRSPRAQGRRVESLGGGPFVIYKLRTMTMDAEAKTGPVWASENDARVTRVGRWLRYTRLDELPQFWNVLKGDMAVVGPRPERPSFVRNLCRELSTYALRQSVPPGITGLAQVNRKADRTLDDVRIKLDYDLEYLHRRSVRLDLLIMLWTVPVILRRS